MESVPFAVVKSGLGQSIASRPASYVQSAPVADVMFDQLEYLVAHSGRNCAAECPDCARLAHVREWLLRPFQPTVAGI